MAFLRLVACFWRLVLPRELDCSERIVRPTIALALVARLIAALLMVAPQIIVFAMAARLTL